MSSYTTQRHTMQSVLFYSTLLLFLFSFYDAAALPRFSLLTGTRCSACHMNPQGSGLRTELGWQAMNETGIFKWHAAHDEFDTNASTPTNTLYDGLFIAGGDARGQLVRVSTTGERLFIPMQLATSLAILPSHQVTAYTNINFASIAERARGGSLFPGEADFDAAVQYQPSIELPSIRAGMIQPSIGIRQDDHTAFSRREAAMNGTYLIPAYYNEVGAEVTYEGLRWLTVNAGVFNAKNLAEVDPTIGSVNSYFDFKRPTVSGRVLLWPQLLEQGINGEAGASILMNGSFQMINAFGGFGLADKATIYLEGLYSKNADNRIIRNFSLIGTYQLIQWLSADWRYDWGQTELYPSRGLFYANAFTFGVELFVLPYIEIRPEYRVMQKNPYLGLGTYTAEYTAQLHIFY